VVDRLERGSATQGTPIPPALLRFRVGETTDSAVFVAVGENASNHIESALVAAGRPLADHQAVLDFGCGCSRIVALLAGRFPQVRFFGADVDSEAIEWSRRHFPAVQYEANGRLPPLQYADEMFDLVYSISVFTHLSVEFARQWLTELWRVVRPGGTLLITVHGENTWYTLSSKRRAIIEREGHLFATSSKLRGIVPDWYHTAYYSEKFVRELLSDRFDLLEYIPCGLGYQDVVVATRALSCKLLHGPEAT